MQISLLHWPPVRLVRESILNHNLRHPATELDAEKRPWPEIVPVIYAFVRHELTNYDAELRVQTEGAYDEEKRNRLVAQVTARARAAFPWLRRDPRPFPQEKKSLELDETARRLADLRTLEYHIKQVLSETRDRERRKELKEKLGNTRQRIANLTSAFDSSPPPSDRHIWVLSRKTQTGAEYDWFGYRFHLNHLELFGFTCPLCGASVMETKRAFPFGQGQKRFFDSCYCVCIATGKFIRLTSKRWGEILREHNLLERPPPEEPE